MHNRVHDLTIRVGRGATTSGAAVARIGRKMHGASRIKTNGVRIQHGMITETTEIPKTPQILIEISGKDLVRVLLGTKGKVSSGKTGQIARNKSMTIQMSR